MVDLDTEAASPTLAPEARPVLCQALEPQFGVAVDAPCEAEATRCVLWAGTLLYLCVRHACADGYLRVIPDLPEVPLRSLPDDLLRQTGEKLAERYEQLLARIAIEQGLAKEALMQGADVRELLRERGLGG